VRGNSLSNNTITRGLIGIIVIIFAVFFVVQNYVYDSGNRFEDTLKVIMDEAKKENWEMAQQKEEEFNKLWLNGKYLIALNNAEHDYSEMKDAIEVLRSSIEIKDRNRAVESANRVMGHFINFKKIVPEP